MLRVEFGMWVCTFYRRTDLRRERGTKWLGILPWIERMDGNTVTRLKFALALYWHALNQIHHNNSNNVM